MDENVSQPTPNCLTLWYLLFLEQFPVPTSLAVYLHLVSEKLKGGGQGFLEAILGGGRPPEKNLATPPPKK